MEYKHNYNYQKCVELLKYDASLLKQNKLLREENKLKYSELKSYLLQINEHLHWSKKNAYSQLIEDFLNYKIDAKKFDNKFSKMVNTIEDESRSLTKNYEMLKEIRPNSASFEFAKWISEIYLCCNEFYEDYYLMERDDPAIKSDEQLRSAVTTLYTEIQKYS